MIYVFDIDDTICDTDGYSEKYIEWFIKSHNLPYKKVKDVTRYAEEKFDWDFNTAVLWNITYGDEMMLNFPCKEGVRETINALYDNGDTIIFATARSKSWHKEPEKVTKAWLYYNGIKYHKLITERDDKEIICKELNADVFVDDDLEITARVSAYCPNVKTFLMTSKYNKDKKAPEGTERIFTLSEIVKEPLAEEVEM